MYVFEALSIFSIGALLVVFLVRPGLFSNWQIIVAGILLLLATFPTIGWRWQMIPALLAYVLIVICGLQNSRSWTRIVLAILAIPPLAASAFLSTKMPVAPLPAPSGIYTVGTFNSGIVDDSRVERFVPEQSRQLGIQVWYPAEKSEKLSHQTLMHDLYSGSFDMTSFATSYLGGVHTNSLVDANMVNNDERFPVILFNHGLFMMADQNVLLMEHLASNGYVVVSIVHPYEALKVSLPLSGSTLLSSRYPEDVGFSADVVSDGGIGEKLGRIVGKRHSDLVEVLYRGLDEFVVADEEERWALVKRAVSSDKLEPLSEVLTERSLYNFYQIRSMVRNRSVQTWVEDIQFVAGNIHRVQTQVPNFLDRVDLSKFGVIGMSYGGAAAGEFCKIDFRCAAGSNLDGTQFGSNWKTPVQAPFVMMYSDANPSGNDYAYFPVAADFYEVHVTGSEHIDFLDASYAFPILKTLGLAGKIDKNRMVKIVNDTQLAFFDHYLKGTTEPPERVLLSFGEDVRVEIMLP